MGSRTVMVIDNSDIQCRALSRAFSKFNTTTLIALNGTDGLTQASLNNPDVIVLDLLMPDMDGLKVCEQLKKSASTQQIPVVLFTGRTRMIDIMQGFAAGADMFIGKGLGYDRLVHYVRTILAEKGGYDVCEEKQHAEKTHQDLLKAVHGAFDGVVRAGLEASLGKEETTALIGEALQHCQPAWDPQTLCQWADTHAAVRQRMVEFNRFMSELFQLISSRVSHFTAMQLKETFEQQLALFD